MNDTSALSSSSVSHTHSSPSSDPACPWEEVLITEELKRRTRRQPDYREENEALVKLAQTLTHQPGRMLPTLVEQVLKLCQAGSAGVSIYEPGKGTPGLFRWHAVAGALSKYLGGTMPRVASPCGIVVDRDKTQLFRDLELAFPEARNIQPACCETLLTPFHSGGRPVGTVWVVAHTRERHFDAEDQRQLESLSAFAAAAYEMRQSDAEMRDSTQLTHSLMNSTADCVKLLDLEGRILTMNQPGLAMLELAQFSSIASSPWKSLWPEAAHGEITQALEKARRGETGAFQAPCPTAKGTPKWWDVVATPVRDGQGEIIRILVISRDVTESRKAELALREASENLRLAADAGAVGIWRVDLLTNMATRDGNMNRLLGLEPVETTQHLDDFFQRILEEDRPAVAASFQNAVNGTGVYSSEMRIKMPDGRVRWLRDKGRILRNAEGLAVMATGVAADITEIKQTEDTLRENAERLKAMFGQAAVGIMLVDVEGRIIESNPRFCQLLGWQEEEVRNMTCEALTHPEDWPRNLRLMQDLLANKRPDFVIEKRYLRHDGAWLWVNVSVAPLRDARGQTDRLLAVVEDINTRKQTELALHAAKEEAEAASRAKDHFLAQLSHELRTPLTPALMAAAALRDDETLSDAARDQLAMIERNVALEARLIDDLLDLTRVTRGKITLKTEMCDVHALIGMVVEILRDESRSKKITISLQLEAEDHYLCADAARLQQVLWNLLRNAVKFTSIGGQIRILSRDMAPVDGDAEDGASSRLCLEVSDNGAGFAPTDSLRIFEPFEQARLSQEGAMSGLGLGLAIARAIVDLHGGKIEAYSKGIGYGATFRVELPGAAPTARPKSQDRSTAPRVATPADHSSPAPLRLLVVEDHEPTLQVLTRLLRRDGHRITTATSVAEALSWAEGLEIDLVISDLGLPDGSGCDLMKKLRDRYGMRGIALSGYGMDEDIRRAEEAGFVAHLTKPVNVNDIRRVLHQIAASSPGPG